MNELTLEALAARIEALEKKLAEQAAVQTALATPPVKDWRRSIGMYGDLAVSKQIDAEGDAIREAEREAARRGEPE